MTRFIKQNPFLIGLTQFVGMCGLKPHIPREIGHNSAILYQFCLICCLLFCTAVGLHTGQRVLASGIPMTIAQVHYSGGGDWYGDATVIKNWLRLLRTRTDIETAEGPGNPEVNGSYALPVSDAIPCRTRKYSADRG